MMTPTPIQLGSSISTARSSAVSSESLTNLYLEQNPSGAKSLVTLYGTPGLKSWLSGVGDGPIRGIVELGTSLYVVSGNELYRISSSKTKTLIGTIEGTGNVYMTENGTHVAIAVSGGKLYAANASGVIELSQSGMNGATYQDGYGIFSQAQSEKFWITALDDMTSINALDFSTADSFPDLVTGIISHNRQLVIFGQDTVEWWYNSGNASFPFERVPGGVSGYGCRAPGSPAVAGDSVFWLGNDSGSIVVLQSQGYQAMPVSTHWVDRLISGVADFGSAQGWSYRQEGHTFYVLSFSDLTIVYDLSTGLWHRRKTYGIDRWRANCHVSYQDIHIVGDYETGDLYELDLDTYTDNGTEIRRECISPPIENRNARIVYDEFFLDMETGVGLVSGQGSAPLAMLDWTDDGAATWSNVHTASIGALGNRNTRAVWTRLGSSYQRQFRVAISDPVKVAIIGAYARARKMGN